MMNHCDLPFSFLGRGGDGDRPTGFLYVLFLFLFFFFPPGGGVVLVGL